MLLKKLSVPLVAAAFVAQPLAALAQTPLQCVKQSPAHEVAVVELYTSEGCNSCPPADQWLSGMGGAGYTYDSVVPLSMHVDYWDSLGWKDRFAKAVYTGRQYRLSGLANSKVVYTPEVFVNTRELRSWNSERRFEEAVHAVNAKPARASIRIALEPPRDGKLAVHANFRVAEGVTAARPQAFLAVFENRLRTDVKAGENRGVTLGHDQVVREWIGPVELDKGALDLSANIALEKDFQPHNMGVAAFVQDEASRDVLQATALHMCGV